MTYLIKSAAILALLATTACTNTGGLFGGGGNGGNGVGGAGVGTIEETSLAYFQQTIGDTVLFPVNQSTLTPSAITLLTAQAGWLNTNATSTILIEGHADEQGTREYNIALGSKRASSVRDFLVSQGVADNRISVISFGKERPLEVCSSEACWSKNRRSVTVVRGAAGV